MKKKLIPIVLGFLSVWVTSCKLNSTDVIEENLPQVTTDTIRSFAINDFNIKIDRNGILKGSQNNYQTTISSAGLWIAMEQDGQKRANLVLANWNRYSNYVAKYDGKPLGVYYLDASIKYSAANWPVSYGAPISSSGNPLVNGDAMCWQALFSDTTKLQDAYLSKPIKGLRVSQALYGYKGNNCRNVIFVRYNITNTTLKTWNDVYIGFWSDTDINQAYNNKTGYDSTRSLVYTYALDNLNVDGFTFLQTPRNIGVTSSRIMRKNNYIDSDFGELDMKTPTQVLYALQGLSNSGAAMVNPVTGYTTKFAFTGDPVRQTGWLDTPIDTRNIIASGPFTLAAGETKVLTVVWISVSGINLSDSITNLKEKIDYIRGNPSLWSY